MKPWLISESSVTAGFPATVLFVLRLLLALFFAFMALKNLAGDPAMAADFQRWGYSDAFRRVTAGLQLVGAVAILLPSTCFLGAALLTAVLLGAAATHVMHDPLKTTASPLVFLALVSVVLVMHRPPALR